MPVDADDDVVGLGDADAYRQDAVDGGSFDGCAQRAHEARR